MDEKEVSFTDNDFPEADPPPDDLSLGRYSHLQILQWHAPHTNSSPKSRECCGKKTSSL